MAYSDHYGFDLATDSAEAAAAYDRGARSFVAWRADAMAHLKEAISADPDFAMPKVLMAWILHAAPNPQVLARCQKPARRRRAAPRRCRPTRTGIGSISAHGPHR